MHLPKGLAKAAGKERRATETGPLRCIFAKFELEIRFEYSRRQKNEGLLRDEKNEV